MGKTHEDLEKAEEKYQRHLLRSSRGARVKWVATPSRRTSISTAKEMFNDLKTVLFKGSMKSILFIGISDRDGSYTHAINFASALTKDSQLRVLLVDLCLWTLSLQEVFRIDDALGLFDLFGNGGEMTSKITKVGPGNLYTVRWGRNHAGPVALFEYSRFGHFLKMMGKRFDYIILNAPPVSSFSECRALCAKVDGAVLVLKTGKTGRQVALRAREQLNKKSGHKLVGVVFDRQKAFHSKYALIASAVIGVCLVFTLGLFIGNSWLKPRENRSFVMQNADGANTNRLDLSLSQPQVGQYAQSAILQEANSSKIRQEEISSKTGAAGEQIHDLQAASVPTVGTKEDAPAVNDEAAVSERNEVKARQTKVVVVKRGDSLFKIINRAYGKYNNSILKDVLRENPEIHSLDRIYEGQVIKLPRPVDKAPEGNSLRGPIQLGFS